MKSSQIFLLSLLFPLISFAGNINLDSDIEDCDLVRNLTKDLRGIAKTICAKVATSHMRGKASQGQVIDACTNVKAVSLDPNRDNSMYPASTGTNIERKVG